LFTVKTASTVKIPPAFITTLSKVVSEEMLSDSERIRSSDFTDYPIMIIKHIRMMEAYFIFSSLLAVRIEIFIIVMTILWFC